MQAVAEEGSIVTPGQCRCVSECSGYVFLGMDAGNDNAQEEAETNTTEHHNLERHVHKHDDSTSKSKAYLTQPQHSTATSSSSPSRLDPVPLMNLVMWTAITITTEIEGTNAANEIISEFEVA